MRHLLLAAAASLALLPQARAACPSAEAMQALSRSILANTPSSPLTGMTSLADGQCAQDQLVQILVPHFGQPVGYKVGLTNAAAQQRFGVAHPVTGTIYQNTIRLRSGGETPARFGAVPNVEADMLVRVSSEAINDARDHLAVLRSIDLVIPFIEMPDLVLASGMDGPNLLAINVGARLGVVGEPIPVQVTEDFAARLASMTVVLSSDQREIARAPGTALLGHPLNVIPWLAQDLAQRGQRMRVGQYISLGGFSPAVPAEAGRTYTVRYEGLLAQPVNVTVRTN
ncbi:2-keto-4-pentenoate hydratase [Roseococcus sp. YIM B11640]|uniref:2-keto-4-pentenoate hydratase n=1 Tax=Roseococcus sp. YIM B11640 TaxID=3133973 RepID=UPI003C798DFA